MKGPRFHHYWGPNPLLTGSISSWHTWRDGVGTSWKRASATRKHKAQPIGIKEGGLFISKHRGVAAWNNSGFSLASLQSTLLWNMTTRLHTRTSGCAVRLFAKVWFTYLSCPLRWPPAGRCTCQRGPNSTSPFVWQTGLTCSAWEVCALLSPNPPLTVFLSNVIGSFPFST